MARQLAYVSVSFISISTTGFFLLLFFLSSRGECSVFVTFSIQMLQDPIGPTLQFHVSIVAEARRTRVGSLSYIYIYIYIYVYIRVQGGRRRNIDFSSCFHEITVNVTQKYLQHGLTPVGNIVGDLIYNYSIWGILFEREMSNLRFFLYLLFYKLWDSKKRCKRVLKNF